MSFAFLIGIGQTFGQVTYNGNGNTGFGGPLGDGSIEISDDGTTISFVFTRGSDNFNDGLVLYFDSETGGFNSTSGFTDQSDYSRQAVSGYNGNTSAPMTFRKGFEADYAVSVHVNSFDFAGTFDLVSGGSHTFVSSANLVGTPGVSETSYSFSIDKSDIGISGTIDFDFVATYLNPNSSGIPFRSDEAIGQGIGSGNPGQSSVTYTSSFNYSSGDESFGLEITGTEGWRMLSTPTSDNTYDDLLGDLWTQGIGTGADVTNGTASVQLYNTTTDNFAAATDLGATMTTGVGFITYVYSDDDYTNSGADAGFPKTLSLSGTENSGSVSPTLNTEGDAFTLVGNPYASTIDWDLLTRSDVTGTVYVYDNSDPGYISWNGTTGDLTDGLIATYQGFWVQNTSGSPTPSLTIEEADQSSGGTFYKDTAPTTIEFAAEMGELTGNAFFSFTNTGELGKDNYDGLRLEPLDFKEYLAVSTVVGEEQLSINNLPADLNQEVILPMDVEAFTTTQEGWTPKAGEITLSWPELNNLPENWEITLTDYQTGITTNILTQNSYTFTAEEVKGKVKPKTMFSVLSPVSMTKAKSADDASRFGITIAPNTSVSNEPDTKPTTFALNQNYPNPFNPSTTISYSVGQTGPVNITVYNVMGQKVAELVNATKTAGNNYQISWDATAQASGIYYYRLTAPGQVLTRQMTLIK